MGQYILTSKRLFVQQGVDSHKDLNSICLYIYKY